MRPLALVRSGALLAVLALLAGCHRVGPPSEAYAKASATFLDLYADQLSDAYLDPRMDEVMAQLRSVPKDSVDAKAAAELLTRIEKGRAKAKKAAADLARAEADALAPVTFHGADGPSFQTSSPAAAPDAGGRAPTAPEAGMATSDFLSRFGGCFVQHGTTRISGEESSGTLYALASTKDCQKRFPRFATRYVVAGSQKVLGTALVSSVRTVPVKDPVERVTVKGDDGTPSKTADGGSR